MKSYTCACGWMVEAETLDELIEEVRKHGEERHSEVEIDIDKICAYLEEKYRE